MAEKTLYNVRNVNLSMSDDDWDSSGIILKEGEIGFSTDSNMYKKGDGSSLWSELDYAVDIYYKQGRYSDEMLDIEVEYLFKGQDPKEITFTVDFGGGDMQIPFFIIPVFLRDTPDEDLISLSWAGDMSLVSNWTAGETYEAGRIVVYEGAKYQSLYSTTDIPGTTEAWIPLAPFGALSGSIANLDFTLIQRPPDFEDYQIKPHDLEPENEEDPLFDGLEVFYISTLENDYKVVKYFLGSDGTLNNISIKNLGQEKFINISSEEDISHVLKLFESGAIIVDTSPSGTSQIIVPAGELPLGTTYSIYKMMPAPSITKIVAENETVWMIKSEEGIPTMYVEYELTEVLQHIKITHFSPGIWLLEDMTADTMDVEGPGSEEPVDSLDSYSTSLPLAANQGRILNESKAEKLAYEVTILSTDWNSSYEAVKVAMGLLPTDDLLISLKIDDSSYIDVLRGERAKIYKVVAGTDELTFYATEEPTEDLTFDIMVIR